MALSPGTKLGPYEILSPLGAGGMGEVYRARDTRLDRDVAIKVLPVHRAETHDSRHRFQREAKAISSLPHPNICALYDVGSENGVDFLVMELLDGETLQDRLLRGPLPLDQVMRTAMEIADALDAAHRKGVVHRDLKPSNIFLTKHGEAKVLDFGLVKLKEEAAKDERTITSPAHLTSPGITVGTVAYMSPEQARGEDLDARSDIFSLGAVLYEATTGQLAFPGKTSAIIFKAILDQTPVVPSKLELDFPSRLEEIILKALEKDRDVGYQSAAEIRADLKRLRRDTESGKAGVASGPLAVAPKRSQWKRISVSGGFVAAVAALVVAVYFLMPRTNRRIDSIAVLPFASSGGTADTDYLSDGLTESLIDSLTRLPQLKVKSRNSVFRYKGKDVDPQQIGTQLRVNALLTGRLVQHGDLMEVSAELTDVRDNTQIWGDRYSRKTSDLIALQEQIAADIADKLRAKLTSEQKQQVARQGTQNQQAYELYLKGRYQWNRRTLNDLRTAVSYFNQAIAKDPQYAAAYAGIADSYVVMSSYGADPNDSYPKAKAAALKALELDPRLARPHMILGEYKFLHEWDFFGAEKEYRQAFQLDPNDATAHQWYAEKLTGLGVPEQQAIAEAQKAHDLDPLSSIIADVLGMTYLSYHEFDRALEVCGRLVQEDPGFSRGHNCLAVAYMGKRMFPETIAEFKAMSRTSGDEMDALFVDALEKGFNSDGWNAGLARAAQALSQKRKSTYVAPTDIARLYAAEGDKENAFRWLNTALEERDEGLILSIKTNFTFDSLRSDHRYVELLGKAGLPQ